MRITTQMLNTSMRKAGLPLNNMSLLDGMKSSGMQNNPLSSLNQGNAVSQTQKKNYEALRKSAEEMQEASDKLRDKELYEEARESGSTENVSEYVESLLEHYNKTIKSLKSNMSPLNQFYRQNLLEAAQKGKEELESIGITQRNDGSLSLDKDKLKAADIDTLEKVLGGSFTEKTSFLADRIADNAKANVNSASNQYNASGSNYFEEANKYNFWG